MYSGWWEGEYQSKEVEIVMKIVEHLVVVVVVVARVVRVVHVVQVVQVVLHMADIRM